MGLQLHEQILWNYTEEDFSVAEEEARARRDWAEVDLTVDTTGKSAPAGILAEMATADYFGIDRDWIFVRGGDGGIYDRMLKDGRKLEIKGSFYRKAGLIFSKTHPFQADVATLWVGHGPLKLRNVGWVTREDYAVTHEMKELRPGRGAGPWLSQQSVAWRPLRELREVGIRDA